jgi:hypothetical protein
MNAEDVVLQPIFATPFGTARLPVEPATNQELVRLFESRVVDDATTSPANNPLYFESNDDLVRWQEVATQSVCQMMLRATAQVVAATNTYTEHEFGELLIEARGSYRIVRANGCIPARSYSHATWCSMYCVAAPELDSLRADSGLVRLYETRYSSMFIDGSTWRMRPPFAQGHHTWRPAPSQMCVFPASSMHEVACIRGSGSLVLIVLLARFAMASQPPLPPW